MKLASVAQIMDFDPYSQLTTDSAQGHNIGEKVFDADRIFRFAIAGEALTAGHLVTESAGNSTLSTMAVVTGALGAKVINFTNAATTTTAGYFDDGYAVISYGTGLGSIYKISSMAALVSGANSNVYLHDPIRVALDTTSKLDIVSNPYNRCLMTATATLLPVGVPLIDVTANGDYCWLQSRGVCSILSDNTIAAGTGFFNDGSAAGAIDVATEASYIVNPRAGSAYQIAGASGYYHPVFLTID